MIEEISSKHLNLGSFYEVTFSYSVHCFLILVPKTVFCQNSLLVFCLEKRQDENTAAIIIFSDLFFVCIGLYSYHFLTLFTLLVNILRTRKFLCMKRFLILF